MTLAAHYRPEQRLLPRTPLENTKDRQVKYLEELSCMWCKSDNAHSCFSEKPDHIISDMSRAIIHRSDDHFFSKCRQITKANKSW
jgi:hypothetical protein